MFDAMSKWSEADVPDQSGRVAIVTGANTGLGYDTARVLAEHGAHVVMAVRDTAKGDAAVAQLTGAVPQANVTVQSWTWDHSSRCALPPTNCAPPTPASTC